MQYDGGIAVKTKNIEIGDAVLRRLDCLIQLIMEQGEAASWTTTQKIERLVGLGFTNAEIAEILGKPANYITATRSQAKRRRAKGKEHDG